jgi:hypothetical protein
VPLDRTAQGGSRASVDTALWLSDPLHPEGRRAVATLPGTGWEATAVSPDDRQVALLHYLSANRTEVWLLDLASGEKRQLLPRPARRMPPPGSRRPSSPTARACC